MNPGKNNFSLAAKAFIIDDDKLLILKRTPNNIQSPSIWEVPGGRMNKDETPEEGLLREVKEETNLEIEILEHISTRKFTRFDKQRIKMLVFLSKPLSKEIKLSKEHTDYEWINLENGKEKITKFFYKEIDIINKTRISNLNLLKP
ncbi:MAG: NUDIX domain-containing protein [Candidatus Nanoarchaeia archaeon]|nr:NUDIX domain-containing protein [Candidatus Nanoarchaeia archaeon]